MSRYINPFTDFDIAEMTHMDSEKRLEYQASLKAYRDLHVVLDESFNKGEAKGKEEVKIEIVKNMYSEGMELNIISKFTKLSIEKIKKILNVN